jgi:predicted NBD/HSP70 family sugar kinase
LRRINLRTVQAARLNTIRDINRQIVLNYVREREPISRAEIARETELQRSTVSAIVESLKAEGLVEEVGEGESTGGRRPTMLRLRSKEAIALGVSITPTCTTVASSDLAGRVISQQHFLTNPDPYKTIDEITALLRTYVRENNGLDGVGVSLPGLVDPGSGTAVYVPYFKWRDLGIAKALSAALGLPVVIDNDANAVALAELWFGRPEVCDARDFILVLVAEGVGTGIVFDGQVYRGERGAAGEFGHMVIGTNAPVACSCGSHDCWEAFASERAAVSRYDGAGDSQSPPLAFRDLVDRALGGESRAVSALVDTALSLGVGISNLIVGFSPEAVIVGGEITRAWHLVENALTETIEHSVRRGLPSARILPSTLGENPTVRGALSLVLASKFAA